MSAQKKKPAGIGVYRHPSEREKHRYIGSLVGQWEKQAKEQAELGTRFPFVTISREVGCLAFDVGLKLAERLNEEDASVVPWTVYDKEIVTQIADNLSMNEKLVEILTERSTSRLSDFTDSFFKGRPTVDTVVKESMRTVNTLCEKGRSIIIGRAGCLVSADAPRGFHLRLIAPFEWRVEQIVATHKISQADAEQRIRLIAPDREELFKKFYGRNVSDPDLYDITLNQANFKPHLLIELIVEAMRKRELLPEKR